MELYKSMVREKWGEGFVAGPWGWSEDHLIENVRHGAVVGSERTVDSGEPMVLISDVCVERHG
jgi:hypothetical protein